MPIVLNEELNRFEGENDFGTPLAGFDFSVFGALVTNNGAITAPVTANTPANIEFVNSLTGTLSKAPGSQYAMDLQGNGGRLIFNDGDVFGSIRLGNGFDSFFNSGTVQGQIITGNGNDTLTNQIIPGIDGGPETAGTITGGVNMGNGNDTVLNTGVMANIQLGAGNDTYTVGGFDLPGDGLLAAMPAISGGTGSSGDVRGGSGNDTMIGGAADDRFIGGSDDDSLFGNGGRDQLFGQSGNDNLYGGNSNDYVNGGSGNDTIDGGNNNDRLYGGNDDDVIMGGRGNDRLYGQNGNDDLDGGAGNDLVAGGSGRDAIDGGVGRDTLFGGDGDDFFVFDTDSGRDVIRDFNDGDQIVILDALGVANYGDVMANTTFASGRATIDLSGLYNDLTGGNSNGDVLTINNVTVADLDPDAFVGLDTIFIVG